MQAEAVAVLLLNAGLAFAAGIAGQVQEDSGDSIASAEVQFLNPGHSEPVATTQSGSDGQFEASQLPPGDYRIVVSKPGYAATAITVHSADLARVSVRLVRLGIATGRVMDGGGEPIAGASVLAMTRSGNNWQPVRGLESRVDGNGQFRLDRLPPGEYAIAAAYPSGLLFYPSNRRPQVFTVTGGEEFSNLDFVVLREAGVSLEGKLEFPTPAPSFHVMLTTVDRPAVAIASAEADENGVFHFAHVPAGSYELFASGPGSLFSRKRIEVTNQNVAGISLVPQKGRSAALRLRSSGACGSMATVVLTSREDWGLNAGRIVPVTAEETAVVQDLPPGAFDVALQSPVEDCFQTAPVALDLSSDAAPVIVPIGEGGSIRGRLTGRNIDAFIVMLRAVQTYGAGQQPIAMAEPDAAGGFVFAGLPPGQYRVSARPARGRAQPADRGAPMLQLRVSSGLATELDLPVPVLDEAR